MQAVDDAGNGLRSCDVAVVQRHADVVVVDYLNVIPGGRQTARGRQGWQNIMTLKSVKTPTDGCSRAVSMHGTCCRAVGFACSREQVLLLTAATAFAHLLRMSWAIAAVSRPMLVLYSPAA